MAITEKSAQIIQMANKAIEDNGGQASDWITVEDLMMIAFIAGVLVVATICKALYRAYKQRTGERFRDPQGRTTYTVPRPNVSSGPQRTVQKQLTELGPVNYYANERHNQTDKWFQFMYRKVNDQWLTYILRMPSLNGRDGNCHLTHRYKKDNTYWICYDPQPKTLKEAQIISKAWADRELEYIATGVPFEEQHW